MSTAAAAAGPGRTGRRLRVSLPVILQITPSGEPCTMADDIHILYVDDEPGLLSLGKIFLERSGQFIVDTITSAPAALMLQKTNRYDAIISDYQMPEMDGMELLRKIRSSGNTIPFILFTGRQREEIAAEALEEGADFYLQKGGEPSSLYAELSHKIRYAVMRRHAENSSRQYEARLRELSDSLSHRLSPKDGGPGRFSLKIFFCIWKSSVYSTEWNVRG